MTTTTYPVRLFGGRNLGVIYDSDAGTLSIMGQSIPLSSLSADLQNKWYDAVGTVSSSVQTGGMPAFGGTNIGQVIGNILDLTPSWREVVRAAVATYVEMVTFDGAVGDPESFIH